VILKLSEGITVCKDCIIKTNLSLFVILLQFKLTKLKLEVFKSDFQPDSKRYEHRQICN